MKAVRLLLCLLLFAPALAQAAAPGKPDAVTPDGGRYYGPLVGGKLHGRGRIEWDNGSTYEGNFAQGHPSGQGKMHFANGVVYEGGFRDGMMAGRGRMTMPDGSTYSGEFSGDYFSGRGRYEIPQREVYEGEFKLGYYWGRGELVYANGNKYRGDFVRGNFQGKGRYENSDGEVHEGDFDKNEFSGKGTYRRKDGARYDGEFASWRFHGKGRYIDAGGNVYEGTFVNGELNGPGTFKGVQGQNYEGEFSQWRFHGKGVLRHPNGDVYKGGFENGLYQGQGTLIYAKPRPDGAKQETGVWRFGMLDRLEQRHKSSANVETALYNQRELLARAIASLRPRDPGRINLFLLAVGGDGSQEVFRREVEFVTRQFAEKFGAGGRTIALINSRTTVETVPMATRTSIRESVSALAARMDKAQDILFVFLTSHGSKQHELVLSQNSMDLPDLPAVELGRLLRESGIRWKVIVVSACYAGGFIDPLKDENTLVIAAARHDRTSFGCADENEFTYFGRAFFKESLPQASSFQDAFRRAEVVVKEMELRERAAGEDRHSLPQMWSPEPIERQLRRWWTQPR